jgi:hypothetical protein
LGKIYLTAATNAIGLNAVCIGTEPLSDAYRYAGYMECIPDDKIHVHPIAHKSEECRIGGQKPDFTDWTDEFLVLSS